LRYVIKDDQTRRRATSVTLAVTFSMEQKEKFTVKCSIDILI